jgi:hypothetical protein
MTGQSLHPEDGGSMVLQNVGLSVFLIVNASSLFH